MLSDDFQCTVLFKCVFEDVREDCSRSEQEFYRSSFLAMRQRVIPIVERIHRDMPEFTVHDINHLDALWELASLFVEKHVNINPAEAFVFGGAVLLHDAGMTVAAYPHGVGDLEKTVEWQDTVAQLQTDGRKLSPEDTKRRVIPEVLRRLHAKCAEDLAKQSWKGPSGEEFYLIENSDLREFYAPSIGQVAHSHWWPVHKLGNVFANSLGAYPEGGTGIVDRLKLASLLRLADAIHLDRRRAPRFLKALNKPSGHSSHHWIFQEKLAKPRVENGEIVVSAATSFSREEAAAWWLAFDTLVAVDRELQDVDALLLEKSRSRFSASRVRGAKTPESLARLIETRDWYPVDTSVRVTNVPRVIEALGGSKLYGDNPTVAVRELLQNGMDAIRARRLIEGRSNEWGKIQVSLESRDNVQWLLIEDTGIGMSERVLTGPLLDFGASYWKSNLAMEEFPGLLSKGMNAAGQFGIGFYSVFMLGDYVRVVTRRSDCSLDSALALEFRDAIASRPILYRAADPPVDGGTRIEVRLAADTHCKGGLLRHPKYDSVYPLGAMLGMIAPASDVTLVASENGRTETVVVANDWLRIDQSELLDRISGRARGAMRKRIPVLSPITAADGNMLGRAGISGFRSYSDGCIVVGGLRAEGAQNFDGVLVGRALTASRDTAVPLAPKENIAQWATTQANFIANAKMEDSLKADCAEVVLECRGKIGKLPIVRHGSRWLSFSAFSARIALRRELVIHIGADLTFDEDLDEVHPREFEDDFEPLSSIFFVPEHFGKLYHSSTGPKAKEWPDPTHHALRLVIMAIEKQWSGKCERVSDRRTVGMVRNSSIERDVTVFRRSNTGRKRARRN